VSVMSYHMMFLPAEKFCSFGIEVCTCSCGDRGEGDETKCQVLIRTIRVTGYDASIYLFFYGPKLEYLFCVEIFFLRSDHDIPA